MPTLPLTDIEKRSWEYAKLKHQGVFRKFQGASYFDGHVAKVFGLLKQVDTDPILGCAALLHDTIEDTDATWEEIKNLFGKRVANIVNELTSDEQSIQSKGKRNYLLDKMVHMSNGALLIKLCDRLQNISDAYNASEKFRSNYYNETRHIISSLKDARRMNRKQMRIVQQIEGLLKNIKSRYKYEKMTYIKKFNEANQFTILDDKVKDMLPDTISIYSTNGSYKLKKDTITREVDILRANYSHNTSSNGNETQDGEPDNLEFDMHFMRSGEALKIAVDISYGDSMQSEFTITTPNKVKVGHYTGINSDADPDTHFGFEDKTLSDLCNFFNQFGFKLKPQDFNFIDKYPDTYVKEDVKLTPLSQGQLVLVVNNDKSKDGKYLKDLVQLLKTRGIEYKIATTTQDVKRISENNKIIGCILSGSEFSLIKPLSKQEGSASKEVLKSLNCPILGICYGAQLMAKEAGGEVKSTGKRNLTHVSLSEYKSNHPLFKDVDMKNVDFSFDFSDMIKSCPGYEVIGKVGNYIVAFSDDSKKRFGLLFHPEDTERSWKVIDNFVSTFHNNQSEQDNLKTGKFQHVKNFESFNEGILDFFKSKEPKRLNFSEEEVRYITSELSNLLYHFYTRRTSEDKKEYPNIDLIFQIHGGILHLRCSKLSIYENDKFIVNYRFEIPSWPYNNDFLSSRQIAELLQVYDGKTITIEAFVKQLKKIIIIWKMHILILNPNGIRYNIDVIKNLINEYSVIRDGKIVEFRLREMLEEITDKSDQIIEQLKEMNVEFL